MKIFFYNQNIRSILELHFARIWVLIYLCIRYLFFTADARVFFFQRCLLRKEYSVAQITIITIYFTYDFWIEAVLYTLIFFKCIISTRKLIGEYLWRHYCLHVSVFQVHHKSLRIFILQRSSCGWLWYTLPLFLPCNSERTHIDRFSNRWASISIKKRQITCEEGRAGNRRRHVCLVLFAPCTEQLGKSPTGELRMADHITD